MYAEVVAQMLQNGEQIGHAGSIACGLRVRWNWRYDQQLHPIASNCRPKVVIARSNEILLFTDKLLETGIGRTMSKNLGSAMTMTRDAHAPSVKVQPP
jgi:hypothetical protein